MEQSREKMIALLERILAEPHFERVGFVEAYQTPNRPEFGRNFFSTNRISYVMSGHQVMDVGSGTTYEERSYPKGTVVVMKPYCLTNQSWGPDRGRELFGIVVRPERFENEFRSTRYAASTMRLRLKV